MLVFFSHEKCAVKKRENNFQLVFSLFVDGCCTSCCFGEIKNKIQWNEQRNTAKEKSGGDWRETLTSSYE